MKKKGSKGILYLARDPKLKVETPTAKAKTRANSIVKATSGLVNAFNAEVLLFHTTYSTSNRNPILSRAENNISGFLTSHR
jgi:hypothetical protein